MEIQVLTESAGKRETLPDVVNRIFSICKNDPHFRLKSEMESVEYKLQTLKKKIAKQERLLAKSSELTETVKRRIALIQQENETKQTELLETLGSEL
jgi:hypothetical protein